MIFAVLYFVPIFKASFAALGWVQIFFSDYGVGTVFGRALQGIFSHRRSGQVLCALSHYVFWAVCCERFAALCCGNCAGAGRFCRVVDSRACDDVLGISSDGFITGLLVSLGGAYKDAPFEGFKILKFQRSGLVLAICSPLFYFLNDPMHPISLGFLVYMNGGLERFVVEYYKTYIQRTMSGKFRPDLPRIQRCIDAREKFHYGALVIIVGLVVLYVFEIL